MARWCLHVDSADEMAEWNKALTELQRRLARKEAEAVRDGKAFSEKTLNMVSDFDRYLSKHGYLTTKQVDALVDIAKQNDIQLSDIPPK